MLLPVQSCWVFIISEHFLINHKWGRTLIPTDPSDAKQPVVGVLHNMVMLRRICYMKGRCDAQYYFLEAFTEVLLSLQLYAVQSIS